MTVTIALVADPVTQGATEIQSTTFATVNADYETVDWSLAQKINRELPYKLYSFPTGSNTNGAWMFTRRKDLTGMASRTLFGFETMSGTYKGADTTNSTGVTISPIVGVKRVNGHIWYPITYTRPDGIVVPLFLHKGIQDETLVSEESGNPLPATNVWRMMEELLGFFQTRGAAGVPTLTPVLNLHSGSALPF